MTAKEWLARGCGITAEIELLRTERDKLYTALTNVTPRLRTDKVQTSRRDTTTEMMAKYADYGRLLDERMTELVRVKTEITEVIYRLSDSAERRILFLRYVQDRSWGEIAAAVGYERRYTFRLYAKALKKIDEILEKDTKRH